MRVVPLSAEYSGSGPRRCRPGLPSSSSVRPSMSYRPIADAGAEDGAGQVAVGGLVVVEPPHGGLALPLPHGMALCSVAPIEVAL